VRNAETGEDHLRLASFQVEGSKNNSLFDGTEQLLGITVMPIYSRKIALAAGLS